MYYIKTGQGHSNSNYKGPASALICTDIVRSFTFSSTGIVGVFSRDNVALKYKLNHCLQ